MPIEYRDDQIGNGGAVVSPGGNDGDGTSVNPAAIGGESAPAAPAPKRRGRPTNAERGIASAPGPAKAKVKTNSDRLDLSGILALFVSTHVVIANATGVKELAITEDEGKQFLQACENVARHYSVTTTQKTLDWLALIGAGVQIYGTRAMVIIADKKPAKEKPVAHSMTVVPQQSFSVGAAPVIIPDHDGSMAAE